MNDDVQEVRIQNNDALINDKTKLPLGIVASVVVTAVAVAMWLNHNLSNLHTEINDLSYEVRSMKGKIDEGSKDRFSSVDMAIWVERLKSRNPNLVVPDVNR